MKKLDNFEILLYNPAYAPARYYNSRRAQDLTFRNSYGIIKEKKEVKKLPTNQNIYDNFLGMCMVEMRKRYGEKQNIILAMPLSHKKVSDKMLLKIMAYAGVLGYQVYIRANFFKYLWLKLHTKTTLRRLTRRTKLENGITVEECDALEWFDRPARALNLPITIVEETYNAYYN